ncbi:HlyD family efflux transporter periplasmic adaptor subunit [Pseudooceanicola nanhaiensis]|uniref:HlyD family efflux transporter periplasmic adaptor subunit n=1 Tax=Pseudooceanicola nanhaiensis TaxID=375761 RepID=UPI001CD536CC|nr:HlyD family efflux transporter periplasmic adaptor subunit [Pseudooceanicola nanhaiensis]MCA0921685.1 HlyD family efflux transporter periplasmic adaptor subunit [Pseudooceanicola nanhaiensis]
MTIQDQGHRRGAAVAAPARTAGDAARMQDAAWDRLAQAQGMEAVAGPWLQVQMRQAAAEGGAVYWLRRGSSGTPEWQALARQDPVGEEAELLKRCAESGAPVVIRPAEAPRAACLAHPVALPSGAVAAVALLRLAEATPQRLRGAGRALAWGAPWLREALLLEQHRQARGREARVQAAQDIFAAAMQDHEARRAAIGAVTRLAQAVGADRVSLGFRRRGRTQVVAVSHSAEFGRRMSLTRHVAAAMDEALDQRAVLTHPAPAAELNATRAQAVLARQHGPSAVVTLPVMVGDLYHGAITVERPEERPYSEEEIAFLDLAAALVGPVLWEKRQNDKWLIFKVFDSVGHQFTRLFGPGHAGRKLAVLALAGLTALFATWTAPYRVAADARVEGAVQRVLVAPFDGFLRTAPVRAGDRVAEGALLAEMDDRDLTLERLRWMAERRQKALEYDRAIGEQNRAEAEIIRAQVAQADAQLRMIDASLERARLTAPFDGVVVAGDQSQNIGGSVTRGTVLYEIAPEGDYRVVMKVPESRISEIAPGQRGELVVTALPGTAYPFEVTAVTPVAEAAEGRNTFRVEAVLDDPGADLGPGMQGVAKVDTAEQLMIRIWTRDLADWARLTWWGWVG